MRQEQNEDKEERGVTVVREKEELDEAREERLGEEAKVQMEGLREDEMESIREGPLLEGIAVSERREKWGLFSSELRERSEGSI